MTKHYQPLVNTWLIKIQFIQLRKKVVNQTKSISFDIKVNTVKLDAIKSGKLFFTALEWFTDNVKDTDNNGNTRQIKNFLTSGLQNSDKLFLFPELADDVNNKNLQTQYIEELRKAYIPKINDIIEAKQKAVSKLQLGFTEIMAQCINDNQANTVKCQDTAKALSNWLLYERSMIFFSKAPSADIEDIIPTLKKMIPLRDEIQAQNTYIKSRNSNPALSLSAWADKDLYKTVLYYEFTPYEASGKEYCASYSANSKTCPIPLGIQNLEKSKNVLFNISTAIGDSASNLFSYVPENGYDFVFTGASSKDDNSEYLEEMNKLILKANKSIEIAMLTPPARNTYTYNELVKTFAKLSTQLKEQGKHVDVRIVYGRMPKTVDNKLGQSHIIEQVYLTEFIDDIKYQFTKDEDGYENLYDGELPFSIQFTGFSRSGRASANILSWNHAKLIVADGKYTNIGGTNLFEGYNGANRIKDVSVTFNDNPQLASLVHKFIYNLAATPHFENGYKTSFVTSTTTAIYSGKKAIRLKGSAGDIPREVKTFLNYSIKPIDPTNNPVNMMVIPRYGYITNGDRDIRNISDIAQVELIKSAQETVFISQQAIFPMNKIPLINVTVGHNAFTSSMLEAIRNQLNKGLNITIVKSANMSKDKDNADYDGLSTGDMKKILLVGVNSKYSENLKVVAPTDSKDKASTTGKHIPNHAKMIIIDQGMKNAAAYVGSHNIYDASHAEYGFIVQDQKFATDLYTDYNAALNNEKHSIMESIYFSPTRKSK